MLPGGTVDTLVRNAESAKSYGLELSAAFRATGQLYLTGALGLLHTEFEEFTQSTDDLAGNEFAQAPNVTASIGIDREAVKDLKPGARVRHTGSYFSDDVNAVNTKVSSFVAVDLSVNYQINDRARIYAYANNVFDRLSPTLIFDNGGQLGAQVTTPREVGLGLELTL
ncbi:MAG: TonB-dependent receptor [Pseudomonadota bacterium]